MGSEMCIRDSLSISAIVRRHGLRACRYADALGESELLAHAQSADADSDDGAGADAQAGAAIARGEGDGDGERQSVRAGSGDGPSGGRGARSGRVTWLSRHPGVVTELGWIAVAHRHKLVPLEERAQARVHAAAQRARELPQRRADVHGAAMRGAAVATALLVADGARAGAVDQAEREAEGMFPPLVPLIGPARLS